MKIARRYPLTMILLAILTAAAGAFASVSQFYSRAPLEGALIAPANKCACPNGETVDRLENPSMFNFGRYAGTCIDSCRFRKSELIAHKRGGATLSNLMHDGRFWTVDVPKSEVVSAEIGFEEFLPGIHHVFLLFNFAEQNRPALKTQGGGPARAKIETLVFSPEGIPPQGGKYNFIDAYFERYLIGYRLLSKEQLIAWSSLKLGHEINFYPLNLTGAQASALFREVIQLTGSRSFGVKYSLLANNCSTNVLDLLDRVAPGADDGFFGAGLLRKIERSLPVTGPLGTLRLLVARGLIEGTPSATISARPPQKQDPL